MSKVTVLPLTVTVVNPPQHVDLQPVGMKTAVQPLTVTIDGGTVTLNLPQVQ